MSALGHKRTYAAQQGMSALPPIATAKADMCQWSCPPKANSGHSTIVSPDARPWRVSDLARNVKATDKITHDQDQTRAEKESDDHIPVVRQSDNSGQVLAEVGGS